MGSSVLSFLKPEWKVSDTAQAQPTEPLVSLLFSINKFSFCGFLEIQNFLWKNKENKFIIGKVLIYESK
jgi:hypothetical protein